jgi:thioredoxin-dependent peroxiredoxin
VDVDDAWSPSRLAVGDVAPAFSLPGTGGLTYRLADYVGRPVVLAFYPADYTPVCTTQLASYTEEWERFGSLHAVVLGLSPQSVESHERFSADHGGFAFPLLADDSKAVGRAYGVVGPLGFYRRTIVVVGPDGRIVFLHRSVTGLTYRSAAEITDAIAAQR